jgi:DNA-binding transcriptional ArsR family regulator
VVEERASDDAVFRALADPHRRALLDALFARDGQRLGELCEVLPDMTRFGVMKHLAVLEEANLVVTERHGRTKLHYLNPVPIQQLADRWIAKYARGPARQLTELARQLDPPPRA